MVLAYQTDDVADTSEDKKHIPEVEKLVKKILEARKEKICSKLGSALKASSAQPHQSHGPQDDFQSTFSFFISQAFINSVSPLIFLALCFGGSHYVYIC